MTSFVAHYQSPNASVARAKGSFVFQSEARMGSKALMHDARMAMLKQFGKDSVSWNVQSIQRKKPSTSISDGQLELDFRTPVPERKRQGKKDYR